MPVVGAALRRRGTRTAARALGLVVSLVMIAHGLFGPTLAPKNLATVLGWVQVRGLLVLALLVAGNVFCAACPFMLVRDWARRLVAPARLWPRALRTKWPAIALFVIVLFAYELFDLWSSPWWTAWLVVAYFAGAVLVDSVFKGANVAPTLQL